MRRRGSEAQNFSPKPRKTRCGRSSLYLIPAVPSRRYTSSHERFNVLRRSKLIKPVASYQLRMAAKDRRTVAPASSNGSKLRGSAGSAATSLIVSAETGAEDEPAVAAIDEQGVTEQLVAQAREKGIELVARTGC
jgi:hypothetical protein